MPEELGYQFDRTYADAIERYRIVSTTAERDAIPTGKRYEGMLCYVTSDQVDYQLRGGIANSNWVTANDGNYFDLSTNDSDDITEGTINLFLTAAERAKLAFIAITQAVDLDALETAVAALGSGVNFKGGWDASAGTFPGGGTAAVGDLYITTTAGTVDSVSFALGDGVIAIVINASTTTYAGNWVKTESNSDVTSVIGLTGAIGKTELLAALNVEDGATADQTGAEISSAITTYLGSADWQAPLTTEQVEDAVGGLIAAGTQTNITVAYDDSGAAIDYTVPDFIQVYADLTNLIAGQGSQTDHYLYEVTDASGFTGITSGTAWVRWLGTTDGDEFDYMVVSAAENATVPAPIPLSPYADDTALFAGQANQLTNYIYEVTDGSGFTGVTSGAIWVKYLGTTTGDETDYTIISRAEAGTGSGDVVGPASATDNAFARFDATTGKLIQNSVVTASDTGAVTGVTTLDLNQVRTSKGADVASATALPILTDGNSFNVTGTTTITSINTTGKVGTVIKLRFNSILILTHHATDLILPTGANITTQAGDEVEFLEYATGDFRCTSYLRADGTALVGASPDSTITASTGTTISLANALGNYCNMGSANATTTYTTTGAVDGGWALVFINAASEPTITGATKEHGNVFYANIDMYMRVYYDGTTVKYSFLRKDVLNNADNLQKDVTDNYTVTSADNGYLIKLSSATAKTITVNNDLSDNFECTFYNKGAGTFQFAAGTATIVTPDGTYLASTKACYMFKDGSANSHVILGNLATS